MLCALFAVGYCQVLPKAYVKPAVMAKACKHGNPSRDITLSSWQPFIPANDHRGVHVACAKKLCFTRSHRMVQGNRLGCK